MTTCHMPDILIIVIGILFLLAGFAGCLLPALPGPPLAYAGLVVLHISDRFQFSYQLLIIGAVLVVAVQLADLATPMIGARGQGGSQWGLWGCALGSFTGLLFFPPLGFIIGSFLGAVAGELLSGKAGGVAFKAGVGAFMGFLIGMALKLTLCVIFAFWFVKELCKEM